MKKDASRYQYRGEGGRVGHTIAGHGTSLEDTILLSILGPERHKNIFDFFVLIFYPLVLLVDYVLEVFDGFLEKIYCAVASSQISY
jgi:hypothetical protein